MEIITNHQFRHVVYGYELTAKERAEFDYRDWSQEIPEVGQDCGEAWTMSFVRYRGVTYDLGEFMTTRTGPFNHGIDEFSAWDGYQSDSFYSGILVKYDEDFESVKLATYIT